MASKIPRQDDVAEIVLHPKGGDLQWERGLLCVFASEAFAAQHWERDFTPLALTAHAHPTDDSRELWTVLLQSSRTPLERVP